MCTLEKEFSNINIYINVKKRRFFWGGDFENRREIKENAKENADATSLSLVYIYIYNILTYCTTISTKSHAQFYCFGPPMVSKHDFFPLLIF